MRDVEHQTVKQRCLGSLDAFPLGLLVVAQGVMTTRLVDVELLVVVGLLDHLIVDVDGLSAGIRLVLGVKK